MKALGAKKIPLSDIEKRVFFTDVDKQLQECSLVNEVHDHIRKSFSLVEPGIQPSSKVKKGSFEYLVSDLKKRLLNIPTEKQQNNVTTHC